METETFEILHLLFSLCFFFFFVTIFIGISAHFVINIVKGKDALPFLPTPRKIVDQMIKAGTIKDGDKIIDLGSGIGTIVTRVARQKNVEITGVELNLALHLIAKIRSFFVPQKGKITLIWGDMLRQDLSKYNVVMLFVTATFIEKFLKEKFEKELKKNAKIVSFVFRLKSNKFTEKEIKTGISGFGDKMYVYKKK